MGNFTDQTLASSLNIPSYLLSFPVQALGNRPLGSGTITHTTSLTLAVESLHQGNIPFITSAQAHKIILSLPWLQRHNPTLMVEDENQTGHPNAKGPVFLLS